MKIRALAIVAVFLFGFTHALTFDYVKVSDASPINPYELTYPEPKEPVTPVADPASVPAVVTPPITPDGPKVTEKTLKLVFPKVSELKSLTCNNFDKKFHSDTPASGKKTETCADIKQYIDYYANIHFPKSCKGVVDSGQLATLYYWQIAAESSFNPFISSKKDAGGLAQFLVGTAKDVGMEDKDRFDVQKSLEGQAKYMAQMLNRYNCRFDQALAGYNWGIGNMQKKGFASRPSETRTYISRILGNYGRYEYA